MGVVIHSRELQICFVWISRFAVDLWSEWRGEKLCQIEGIRGGGTDLNFIANRKLSIEKDSLMSFSDL